MEHDFSIFFSNAGIITFVLVLTRITGMIITAPLFSTFPMPTPVKVGLSVMSAFIIYPLVISNLNFIMPKDLISLSILVFKELAVGALIGFCASLIFTSVQIAGQLLSIQMGLAIAEALDPVTQQNVPIVGQFYLFIASMVFITINGPEWLFSSIYNSYGTIPVGMDFSFAKDITPQILYFTSQLFGVSLGIIMPIFAILFITTVLKGIVSKMMPQMNVFMIAMPIQIFIGLSLMTMMMPQTSFYLGELFKNLLENINGIFS